MNNHTFVLILIVLGCLLSLVPNQSKEVSIALISTASTYLTTNSKKE